MWTWMVICLSVLVLQPIQGLPPMALAAMNWISKEKWVDFLFLFFFFSQHIQNTHNSPETSYFYSLHLHIVYICASQTVPFNWCGFSANSASKARIQERPRNTCLPLTLGHFSCRYHFIWTCEACFFKVEILMLFSWLPVNPYPPLVFLVWLELAHNKRYISISLSKKKLKRLIWGLV